MGFTHLRGSLAQNISDITKGGGCPKIKSPMKNYSVIRYFSRKQNSDYPNQTGVVGDGGWKFKTDTDGSYGTIEEILFLSNNYYCSNLNLNTKVPFNDVLLEGEDLAGENNYLNICNQKELVSQTEFDNTVCNIERANDVIEADGSGYYNYYLYKPNHTMNIIKAGEESPTSATAELMEFVYLHAKIPNCRYGELYLEIENFEIVGSITNDHFVYFYYWESARDYQLTEDALGDEIYFDDYPDLLDTNNGNIACKILTLSDLQGQGTDKKLIVWLNKQKSKGESLSINVAIGFKPQDLRKDIMYFDDPYGSIAAGNPEVVTTDEPPQIIFKFKQARLKIDHTVNGLINSEPISWPTLGYVELDGETDAEYSSDLDDNHKIRIPIMALSSIDEAVTIMTPANVTRFGIPNGEATTLFGADRWEFGYSFLPSNTSTISLRHHQLNDVTLYYSALCFFKTLANFDDAQTYRIKLPMFNDAWKYKANYALSGYISPYEYWQLTTSDDFVIRIYAGEELTIRSGKSYAEYKDLVDSFVLLQEFTPSQICGGMTIYNSGQDIYHDIGSGLEPNYASPYHYQTESLKKRNYARYIEFLGSEVSHLPKACFYALIERVGTSIKTVSYSKQIEDTFAYPVGWSPLTNVSLQQAGIDEYTEYAIRHKTAVAFDSEAEYRNYDSMIYQEPQIIDITASPAAEKYFL